MKLDELKNDPLINKWLLDVNGAKQTEKNYLQSMQQYTEFLKMTPEELIDQAESEAGLIARKRNLKTHLTSFRKYLQEKGLADYTVRARIVGVQSFYTSNDILLPKLKGGSKSTTKKENDQIPTKEDIQDCLLVCDPLEKAIMLAGVSSGLAANEIINLKLSEFKAGYDPETQITTLELRREKTKVDFITFFSPEASKAINQYLAIRDRESTFGGTLRQQQIEKQRTTEDSYLFITRNVPDVYLKTRNEELRKLTDKTINKVYRSISEKARKDTKTGYNYIRSHTMRKYFFSSLVNKDCNFLHVELWMGHKIDDVKSAYFRANPTESREIYQKYIPYLTIEKNLDISTNPTFLKAIADKEKAEAEAYRVSVDRNELQKLKEEIEELKGLDRNKNSLLELLVQSPEALEIMKNLKK